MNDSGNLAWMITASALVLLMTPGLAFFYGGLVRAKNIVNTMMFYFYGSCNNSVGFVGL
jgi:Amt family ammonium transporter